MGEAHPQRRRVWLVVSAVWFGSGSLVFGGTVENQAGAEQIDWIIGQQQLYTTGLVESYEGNENNNAYTFDQALAIIVLSHAGEHARARDILNIMADLQLDDPNGAWFECYNAPDSNYAGCWKYVTGPIAWMVVAINFYENETGDPNYAHTARRALGWLDTMRNTDPNDQEYGSLMFSNVDPNIISTEHNLDAYSAYYWRGLLDGNESYLQKAGLIRDYLRHEMWAPSPVSNEPNDLSAAIVFWEGFNHFAFSTDPQSWGILTLGSRGPELEDFSQVLEWLWFSPYGNTRTVQDFSQSIRNVEGFKSGVGEPNSYVWVDGTEHVAAAYYHVGDEVRGDFFHEQMKRIVSPNGGLIHSFRQDDPNNLGWDRKNYRYNYVASTAWHYFNEVRINPFDSYPSAAECRAVDIDDNGFINVKDFVNLSAAWQESGYGFSGDIDGDGSINWGDLILIFDYWLRNCDNL